MKIKRIFVLFFAFILAFTFAACNNNTGDGGDPDDGKEPSGSETEQSVSIDGEELISLYYGDEHAFSASAEGGTIVWAIEGEDLGCEISENGLFTAGQEEGEVTVKAYLKENETISDTCTVTVIEPMYASATALGTSHNNIIQERSFIYTFRTYFKVREYGEFDYSFYYDNKLDTSWWNVSNATANRNGSKFEITEAYFADGGEEADGSVEEGTSVAITFGGETSKVVEAGEEFTSDEVTVNVPEGHFLAFTWTISVSVTSGPTVPFTESTFATCYKKYGEFSSQETSDGFVAGNDTFGDQVLVAPNKILYKRPMGKELVFVGDSITQGVSTRKDLYEFWVAKVADGLPDDYSVWNLGSGWATAGNLASNGAWLKKAATADGLFICLGVNDLGGNITLAEYQELINSIVSEVNIKNPDCIVTLFTVPPFNYSGSQGDTWFEMNEWIRQENVAGVDRYFDFAAVLSQDHPNENYLKEYYMSSASDPHPNGIAGTDVAESFLNWYNGASEEVAEIYDNYVNVDLNSSYELPSSVLVKTEGGFYDYRTVTWNKPVSTSAVGETEYVGTIDGTEKTVTYTVRVRNAINEETIYMVNCGNFLASSSDTLFNSVNDQVYGVDSTSGKQWGCVTEAPYATNVYWENDDKWWAIRCSSNDPAGGYYDDILYKFELEAGSYTLSLGFQDPWSVTRIMELTVDGEVLDPAMDNGSGAQTTRYYTFTLDSDKIVEVKLHETTEQGASLNWIAIGAAGKPADNDMVSAYGGNGYVSLEWSESFGATEYEVCYGTESGVYTQTVRTKELSLRIGGLENGTEYYFVVRGVNGEGAGNYSNEKAATPQPTADENVIYFVDCGTGGLVPLGDKLGTNQSIEDQPFGEDAATGYEWGYTTDGSPWSSGEPFAENSVLVANLSESDYEGKGIHYLFELENGEYTVEVTFYDYWKNPNRVTDLVIEGEKVLEGYTGIGNPETFSYSANVEDGMLNVDVLGGAGNQDNAMVASIRIIRK